MNTPLRYYLVKEMMRSKIIDYLRGKDWVSAERIFGYLGAMYGVAVTILYELVDEQVAEWRCDSYSISTLPNRKLSEYRLLDEDVRLPENHNGT